MALDGFTLRGLSSELKQEIEGGQIQKIFQLDQETLRFHIRSDGKEKILLFTGFQAFPHIRLCHSSAGTPEVPPPFCMLLRKHLEGGRITDISQVGWDRIVKITVDFKQGSKIISKILFIELTGRLTNVVLVDEEYQIFDALKRIGDTPNSKRSILPHQTYELPAPQGKCPPDDFDIARMAQALSTQEKENPLRKIIMNRFDGIGPLTADEILYRSQLEGTLLGSQISLEDWTTLVTTISLVVKESDTPAPILYRLKEGRAWNITLFPYHSLNLAEGTSTASLSEGLEMLSEKINAQPPGLKTEWSQRILKEQDRLQRRLKALEKDLEKLENSPPYQHWGDLLMIHLNEIPTWSNEVSLPDWLNQTEDEPPMITLPLNPQFSPIQNAQNFYKLQKKMERTGGNIANQTQGVEESLAYYDSLLHYLSEAESHLELDEIRQELIESRLLKKRAANRNKKSNPKQDFLTFTSPNGYPIWVGKNNYQNDWLTFKHSRPSHFWFHTQKIPGSHVILAAPEGMSEDALATDIQRAAEIAAFYSKARSSTHVPVDYTRRKAVWKPNGAKPGFVLYEQQKTALVKPLGE